MVQFLSTERRHVGTAEVSFPSFLPSALGGGKWSASRPGRFGIVKEPQHILNRRLGGLCTGTTAVRCLYVERVRIWKEGGIICF